MRITEVARSMNEQLKWAQHYTALGLPIETRRAFTDAEVARVEIERRLGELFATGAR